MHFYPIAFRLIVYRLNHFLNPPAPNVFQLVISYLLRKNFWQQLSTKTTPQFNINCTKAVSIDRLYVSVFIIDFEQLFSLLREVLKKKQPLQMFLSSACNIMKEKNYPGILIDFLTLSHRWENGEEWILFLAFLNFLKTFSFSFNESVIHEVLIFFARSWSSPNLKTFVLKIFRFDKDQKQPPEVFCKGVFLEISQNSQLQPCNFIKKETLARVFSGEFCEISMNLFLQSTSGGCFWKTMTLRKSIKTSCILDTIHHRVEK